MSTPPFKGGQGRSPQDIIGYSDAIICTVAWLSIILVLIWAASTLWS